MDSAPPPIPADAPKAPRRGLPTWAIVLIVVGALGVAFLAVCVLVSVSVVPKMQKDQQKLACMNNLSQLGQIYLMTRQASREPMSHSGSSLWLSYYAAHIGPSGAKLLACPGDPLVHRPETAADLAAYEHVDLDHVARSLCSYAGRDFEKFPIDPDSKTKTPIGACLNHEGCAIVVFEAGDVTRMSLAELGLASDADKIVGPSSRSPILRVLRYGDGSVR